MIHNESEIRSLCGRLGEKIKAMLARGISIEAIAQDLHEQLGRYPTPAGVEKFARVRELTREFACIELQVGPLGASIGPLPRLKSWTASQVQAAMEQLVAGKPSCPGPHGRCPACDRAELCFEGIERSKIPPEGCCPHCGTFLVMDWPAGEREPTFRVMTDEEVIGLPDDTRIRLQRERRATPRHPRSNR